MALLSGKVQLHDVVDVESFVADAIRDGGARLTPDDREELLAEGLRIMVRLAQQYQPGFNGLDPTTSTFAGFASKYLRLKLSDAYHRLQETHRLVTDDTGKKAWSYGAKPASLDAMVAESAEGADHVKSLQQEDAYDSDMAHTLRSVLEKRWPHDRETTVRVGVLMGCDHTLREAASILGIDDREAVLALERIKAVRGSLRKALAA